LSIGIRTGNSPANKVIYGGGIGEESLPDQGFILCAEGSIQPDTTAIYPRRMI
jgi:hypothetical protein